MNITIKNIIAIAITLAAIFVVLANVGGNKSVGALPNLQSLIATSSTVAVGPQEVKTIFSERSLCAARIVTAVASPLMLSFDSVLEPTGIRGVLQGASTTVSYESDQFGCGAVKAYAFSSTTISVTDFKF